MRESLARFGTRFLAIPTSPLIHKELRKQKEPPYPDGSIFYFRSNKWTERTYNFLYLFTTFTTLFTVFPSMRKKYVPEDTWLSSN
jgi:hypothetical protein